jgi:hypothetical protein
VIVVVCWKLDSPLEQVAARTALHCKCEGVPAHLRLYSAAYAPDDGRVVFSDVVRTQHVTRHNTPIHNILSTAPQLSISQKALGTLPEDGNVMPKHVEAIIHN